MTVASMTVKIEHADCLIHQLATMLRDFVSDCCRPLVVSDPVFRGRVPSSDVLASFYACNGKPGPVAWRFLLWPDRFSIIRQTGRWWPPPERSQQGEENHVFLLADPAFFDRVQEALR